MLAGIAGGSESPDPNGCAWRKNCPSTPSMPGAEPPKYVEPSTRRCKPLADYIIATIALNVDSSDAIRSSLILGFQVPAIGWQKRPFKCYPKTQVSMPMPNAVHANMGGEKGTQYRPLHSHWYRRRLPVTCVTHEGMSNATQFTHLREACLSVRPLSPIVSANTPRASLHINQCARADFPTKARGRRERVPSSPRL